MHSTEVSRDRARIHQSIVERTGVPLDQKNLCALEIAAEIGRCKGAPIPFSKCMDIALYGEHGYYSAGTLHLGTAGKAHFTTSCKASVLFGSMIAKSASRTWEALGMPSSFTFCEMGAGEAHLAKSFLPWAKAQYPAFFNALDYKIVERSPTLARRQGAVLQQWTAEGKVSWSEGSGCAYSGRLPRIENGMFFSNELPDAFPVELIRKRSGTIHQLHIGLQDGEWCAVWQRPSAEVLHYIKKLDKAIPDNSDHTVNLRSIEFQSNVVDALVRGTILTIDYRRKPEPRSEGRAIRVFGPPAAAFLGPDKETLPVPISFLCKTWGTVDMTSDPDYEIMATVAESRGLKALYKNSQHLFMEALGCDDVIGVLSARIRQLAANPAAAKADEVLEIAKSACDFRHGAIGRFGSFHAMMHGRGLAAPFSWENPGAVEFIEQRCGSLALSDYYFDFEQARDGFNPKDTTVQRHQYFSPLLPEIPIVLGVPNAPIRISTFPYHYILGQTDSKGAIGIPADLLWGADVLEFRDDSGRLLLDLNDAKMLRPALLRSGFRE